MLQSSLLTNSRMDSVHTPKIGMGPGFPARRRETIDGHRQAVKRVLDVMRLNLTNPLDLTKLAKVASMSRYHFLRVFEEVTGVSPLRFLASLRIERAKKLLLETSLPVTTICFDVGYNSLGTFTRLFVEYVGVSPLSFRNLPVKLRQRSLVSLIAGHLERRRHASSLRTLSGSIRCPEEFTGVSFVGLFETAIPQRKPVDGTIVVRNGVFDLALPQASRSYWVLAAGLAEGYADSQFLILSGENLFVGSRQIYCTASGAVIPQLCDLTLRRPDDFDPPILTALPLLLGA
jgi:AraC family transcriptional regulator